MESIEQRIPDMERSFADQCRAGLDEARAEVLSVVEGKVAALDTSLVDTEKKVKDFSAYMARLEAREEQTQKERIAALAKTLDAFDADLRGKLSTAAKKGEWFDDMMSDEYPIAASQNFSGGAPGTPFSSAAAGDAACR